MLEITEMDGVRKGCILNCRCTLNRYAAEELPSNTLFNALRNLLVVNESRDSGGATLAGCSVVGLGFV